MNIPEDDTTRIELEDLAKTDPNLSLAQVSENLHLSIADTADKLYDALVWNGDDAARVWALTPEELESQIGLWAREMMSYRRKNPDGQGGYRDAMEKISDDLAATRLADDFIKHMRFPCPQCRNSVDACCSNGSPAVDMLSVGPADPSEGQFRSIV